MSHTIQITARWDCCIMGHIERQSLESRLWGHPYEVIGDSARIDSDPKKSKPEATTFNSSRTFADVQDFDKFLDKIVEKLPREIRDMVYRYLLSEEKMLYCIGGVPSTFLSRRVADRQSFLWPTPELRGGFERDTQAFEEIVQLVYEKETFCIVHPHLGSLDTFLERDVFFGTNLVPKHHLRNLTLDFGALDVADPQGNRWLSFLQSLRKPNGRYRNMLTLPSRLLYLDLGLAGSGSCKLKIWFHLANAKARKGHGAEHLFLQFLKQTLEKMNLGVEIAQKLGMGRAGEEIAWWRKEIDLEDPRGHVERRWVKTMYLWGHGLCDGTVARARKFVDGLSV